MHWDRALPEKVRMETSWNAKINETDRIMVYLPA